MNNNFQEFQDSVLCYERDFMLFLSDDTQSVTMTFDLATWFLFVTHCLVMMIICAKLFLNPIMHNKVMGRTRTGFTESMHKV